MMGMSVSWSVLRVATQVHGMIQAADGWMFLPHQRIIFVERTLPCAPKPPQPSQASLSPFFYIPSCTQSPRNHSSRACPLSEGCRGLLPWHCSIPSFTAVPGGLHCSIPGQGLWIPHQGRPFWDPWGLHQGSEQPVPPVHPTGPCQPLSLGDDQSASSAFVFPPCGM